MQLSSTIFRLLFFKLNKAHLLQLNNTHLFAGILGTWLVGIGRYWDDEKASLLQNLGLGSVIEFRVRFCDLYFSVGRIYLDYCFTLSNRKLGL